MYKVILFFFIFLMIFVVTELFIRQTMVEEESEKKEYRWETGYEITWYVYDCVKHIIFVLVFIAVLNI